MKTRKKVLLLLSNVSRKLLNKWRKILFIYFLMEMDFLDTRSFRVNQPIETRIWNLVTNQNSCDVTTVFTYFQTSIDQWEGAYYPNYFIMYTVHDAAILCGSCICALVCVFRILNDVIIGMFLTETRDLNFLLVGLGYKKGPCFVYVGTQIWPPWRLVKTKNTVEWRELLNVRQTEYASLSSRIAWGKNYTWWISKCLCGIHPVRQ